MKTLFDLCTISEGTFGSGTICVNAKARSGDEHRMEERLLLDSEYTLLRGNPDGSFHGLLKEVNVNAVRKIGREDLRNLCTCVPEAHRKNAVFLMNAVTLHELYLSSEGISAQEDGFRLMDIPVMMTDAMPCIAEGSVPVLYGDFSQIVIEDCGRGELVKGADGCSLSCRMNCRIADREAVRGLKMI